jgi:predicted dithiol-disulfide oxidoreductase (DUF899 family)
MQTHKIVSSDEWMKARVELLEAEKAFTRERDSLAERRRTLPWRRIEKDYVFEGPNGEVKLEDLFDGRSQLIVYHFMFAPEWETGCKSCSFWADHFEGPRLHLNARDTSFTAISRAPYAKLADYAERMGWQFKWVSSEASPFNYDFDVSFGKADGKIETYNYRPRGDHPASGNIQDLPGFSIFYKDEDGAIYHCYSAFSRGIDMLNGTYNLLDLTPKGRDETELAYPMAWVRLHDQYA